MISHDITYQHLCQYGRSTVQRFNPQLCWTFHRNVAMSCQEIVIMSSRTSRRSWREVFTSAAARGPRPEFGPLSMKPLPCSTWLGCCPKKVEKKTEFQCNSVLCDFSAHFWAYLKFLHLKWSTSIRWHGAAIYPGWRPSELRTGSTGENGWRVIPANYPLVIYWLVVWNGLKHGFYDFPFMLGME